MENLGVKITIVAAFDIILVFETVGTKLENLDVEIRKFV